MEQDKHDLQELRQRLQNEEQERTLGQQRGRGRVKAASHEPARLGSGLALLISFAALLSALGVAYFQWQSHQRQQALEEDFRFQIAELSSALETLQEGLEASSKRIGSVSSDLSTVRAGMSRSEALVTQARRLVEEIRLDQERQSQLLGRQIEDKADSGQVDDLKQSSQTKFQEIDGQLSDVTQKLQANRQELEKTWGELESLGLRLTEQGRLIATNSGGLQELRSKRGNRDYRDFDAQKGARIRVGDITLELRKTNRDKQYANIRLGIDDKEIDRDKIFVNSPVVFFVGQDRVEYELVVNEVRRNHIRGYVSILLEAPKSSR